MKRIKREELIARLESVAPGLSKKENVEQSSCYVFKDGKVYTFNDAIACSQDCDIGLEGGVVAEPFLDILRKLPEDELQFEATDAEIRIVGTSRKAGVTREAAVLLPIDAVEKPGKWLKLDEGFLDAVKTATLCASSDESQFRVTVVHITSDYVEGCDNAQMARVRVATPIQRELFVRKSSLRHITNLGVDRINETESWVHFRNQAGLVISMRREEIDDYPPLDEVMKFDGKPVELPEGLATAADRALVFVNADASFPNVRITLSRERLTLLGRGPSGWFRERKKAIGYTGPEITFMISPELLIDMIQSKKFRNAEISPDRLRVKRGKTTYVSFLMSEEEAHKAQSEKSEKKKEKNTEKSD